MTWTDPTTGLQSGPITEPTYTDTCQHCPKPLRHIAAGWVDPDGFLRCQKDMDHQAILGARPYLQRERVFALGLVQTLGHPIVKATENGGAKAVVKGDGTPVTGIDRANNDLVHEAVGAMFPNDRVLGEEDVNEQRTIAPGQRVWVVDPVDGTWLLAAGIPWSVVSLALVVDGQTILAAVTDPHARYTIHATLGGGTWMNNNRRLHVNDAAAIESGTVLALPGGRVRDFHAGSVFTDVISTGADVVTCGSTVNDASLVARGFAAGMIYPYKSPWDLAAIALITTEAGGRCTDLRGQAQRYDDYIRGAIVSNGHIHSALVDLIARWRTP